MVFAFGIIFIIGISLLAAYLIGITIFVWLADPIAPFILWELVLLLFRHPLLRLWTSAKESFLEGARQARRK